MANQSTKLDVEKVTFSLPKALRARLDEHVAPRKRGRFIAEAIEERLDLEEQRAALEETAGAWSDESHPELETGDDIEQWLANLRGLWMLPGRAGHG